MNDRIQSSETFSDDSIRRFLLGQLPASQQTLFEEQLFTNSDLEARVRLAEFELADDYAFKRLTESETESFRESYLLTADRTQKLNVSRAIRNRFASESVSETKSTMYQKLMPLLDLRGPALRYAFAALLLIMILATVVLVTKEPQIAIKLIPVRFRPRPQATSTPEMHHAATPSSPAHVEESPPAAPHESPVIVALTSTSSLDQSSVITLPVGEDAVVRFQLSIKEGAQGVYRADLSTALGETLFTAESLKPNGPKASSIDFEVAASTLKSGQYQIRLSRTDDPAKQESSQYYFRIQ